MFRTLNTRFRLEGFARQMSCSAGLIKTTILLKPSNQIPTQHTMEKCSMETDVNDAVGGLDDEI